jgi:hypothetical protein
MQMHALQLVTICACSCARNKYAVLETNMFLPNSGLQNAGMHEIRSEVFSLHNAGAGVGVLHC